MFTVLHFMPVRHWNSLIANAKLTLHYIL